MCVGKEEVFLVEDQTARGIDRGIMRMGRGKEKSVGWIRMSVGEEVILFGDQTAAGIDRGIKRMG